ncbi:MAG: hypothetical protein NT027_00930 [Proteobacteria bacterium]|nr:hypothetical protein [Pseudomonadota bacterium]
MRILWPLIMKVMKNYTSRNSFGLFLRAFFVAFLILPACGNKSLFDCAGPKSTVPCNPRSRDEDARIALDKGDLQTAIEILETLIAEEPTKYDRFPLLSAALAGRSGFDIFNIVKANFGSSSSLLQVMGEFLPTPTSKGAGYDNSLADMKRSVAVLNDIPLELRNDISASSFASSCALQLTLYQAAYSIMLINKYSYSSSGFDPSKLSSMTAEDAALILKNLLGAANSGSSSTETSAAVNTAYESIKSQPGSTDQEKIASYVQANKK